MASEKAPTVTKMEEDTDKEEEEDEEEEEEYVYSDNDEDVGRGGGEEEEDEDEVEYGYSSGEGEDDDGDGGDPMDDSAGGRAGKSMRKGSVGSHGASSGTMYTPGGSRDEDVRVINEDELKELLHEVVRDISSVLDIPEGAATALLRHFSWNKEKLFDQFYADPVSVMDKVGIQREKVAGGASSSSSSSSSSAGGGAGQGKGSFQCRICTDETEACNAFALGCGHSFCKKCWTAYLTAKIGDGPTCVYCTCPEHKCSYIVSEAIFQQFTSKESFRRYEQFSLQSFVDINKRLRFCPGKDCPKIVKAPLSCLCVKCGCGSVFCFRCGDEAHQPCSCDELRRWKEKCQNESETANWILANTKCCPKCNTRIEKNQGCNHMICQQCKHEFCWICMGNWEEHGANTGGYYRCNKYDAKTLPPGETDAAKAKEELHRYLHYYKHHAAHLQSQAYAEKQQGATEKRMVELQESSEGSAWIDVQFLKSATEQLIECRRVLKYTYVFGFYLDDGTPQKELFEHHQENLEKFTEHLSELSEMPLEKMDRTEVINYTRVTGNFLKSLLESIKDGLDDGGRGVLPPAPPGDDEKIEGAAKGGAAAAAAAAADSKKPAAAAGSAAGGAEAAGASEAASSSASSSSSSSAAASSASAAASALGAGARHARRVLRSSSAKARSTGT